MPMAGGQSHGARSETASLDKRLARSFARRRLKSRLATAACALSVVLAIVPLCSIVWYVAVRGATALNLAFFTQTPAPLGQAGGGMVHALIGSGLMVGLGLLMALPCALFTGIYLAEYGDSAFGEAIRAVIDLLNGLPSVLVGVLVYTLIVLPSRHYSAWAGAVALGILAVPLIVRSAETMLRQVPDQLREAGLAMGLPQWRVILRIVLPTARSGIVTGVLLALARIAGETAPLLFTALGNNNFSTDLNQPMASLTVSIYHFALSAYDSWHQLAWGAAFVLILLVFALNLAARAMMRERS